MKRSRVVAVVSAIAIVAGSNVVAIEEAKAQSPIDKLMRHLPKSVNVAGQEIPVTPPLIAAITGIPALAAIIGIIVAATTKGDGGSSVDGSSEGGSSHRFRHNPNSMPEYVTTDEGMKINANVRDLSVDDALAYFSKDGVVSPDGTYLLSDEIIQTKDIVPSRVFSIPPAPGLRHAGFVAVESVTPLGDGTSQVTTRQAFIDEIILETDGPTTLTGTPDYSAYKNGAADGDGVTFTVTPAPDQFYAGTAYDVPLEQLHFKVDHTFKGEENQLKVKGDGKFNLAPSKFTIDADWNGLSFAEVYVTPNYTFEPTLTLSEAKPEKKEGEKKEDKPDEIKTDRCSQTNEAKFAKKIIDKEIPIRIPTPVAAIYLDVNPCVDFSADASVNTGLEWKPKLKVSRTIGATYREKSNPAVQFKDMKPRFGESSANFESLAYKFNGTLKAGVNPEIEVTAYEVLGVKGVSPAFLTGTAGINFEQDKGTLCSVDYEITPSAKAVLGPELKGVAAKALGWIKFLRQKEYELAKKEIKENLYQCPVYETPKPTAPPTTTTPAQPSSAQKLTGRVRELTNRDFTGKDQGVNGETAASRYYVLEFDNAPFTAKMNGNMGRPDTRTVNQVLLGAVTYTKYGSYDTRGNWHYLAGKRVTFDYTLDDAWWPSDTRMPVGMASIAKVQNLKLVNNGSCGADAFTSQNSQWRDPSRLSVGYCDGNFAVVGMKGTDWIVQLEHKDGKWTGLPASGRAVEGLEHDCYTVADLKARGATNAFIKAVPICRANDKLYNR